MKDKSLSLISQRQIFWGINVVDYMQKFYKIGYALRSMKRVENIKSYRKNRKAAMEMSFQFIFSIILVVVVLFVGFFVIRMFLNQSEKLKLLSAVEDIRSKVDEISSSYGASYLMHFKLNSKIQAICFANASNCQPNLLPSELKGFCNNITSYKGTSKNMFFYPASAAWNYKVADAYEIYCGSESQKKECFNVSITRCFIPDLNDEFISFRIEKPNEEAKTYVRMP